MNTVLNKENLTYGSTVTLVTVECCQCGVPFAMPQELNQSLRKTKSIFFCPNGHDQIYSKSTADILREKIARIEQEKEEQRKHLQAEADLWKEHWDKAVKERKKADRKLKRLSNGVCSCCNRTFTNLAEHMKTKHPEQIIKTGI